MSIGLARGGRAHEAGSSPDGDVIIATYRYRIRPGVDVQHAAQGLADLQSTGTWAPPQVAEGDDRAAYRGQVVDVAPALGSVLAGREPVDEQDWVVRIAFPHHNVGDQIPLLLATVYGECASLGTVRLLDLELPDRFTATFVGPRLGIEGIRARLGAHGRPLVLVMMKPSLGLTPARSATVFRELAIGGADLIKDDELLLSIPSSELGDRVRHHALAARQAFEVTGRPTLYFANVTDRPDQMLDHARRALDAGATGLMLDYLAVGIPALSMLAEVAPADVPILAHLAFAGAHYATARSGVSAHLVLGLLPRLAGADVVVYPSPYGSLEFERADHLRLAVALRGPMHGLRSALPAPGGGVHPGVIPHLIGDLGMDLAVGAGGSVHGHPMGSAAGVRAIHQAIEATLLDEDLVTVAGRYPELRAALELWPMMPATGNEASASGGAPDLASEP